MARCLGRLTVWPLIVMVLSAGCDNRENALLDPQVSRIVAPSEDESQHVLEERYQDLAIILSRALAANHVRSLLVSAVRESPWNENKLVLQELLDSELGETLISEAAVRTGRSIQELRDLIVSLPELDLYLPFDEHRASWDGARPVSVIATPDQDRRSFTAYRSDGSSFVWETGAPAPREVVLVAHPAEPKSWRVAGAAPQGGPMYLATSYTLLETVTVYFTDGIGDVELELSAYLLDLDTQITLDSGAYTNESVHTNNPLPANHNFFGARAPDSSNVGVSVSVSEDDGAQGKDYYGSGWVDYLANDVNVNVYHPYPNHTATLRISWTPIAPRTLTTVEQTPSSMTVVEGGTAYVDVKAKDQYGWWLSFDSPAGGVDATITSRVVGNTTIVATPTGSISNPTHESARFAVQALSPGSTTLTSTVQYKGVSKSDVTSITVEEDPVTCDPWCW